VLLTPGFVLVLLFVTSPASVLREHSVGLLLTVAGAAALIKSALNLTRLSRRITTVEPRHLWRVSLQCNVAVLLAAIILFGYGGVAAGIMELVAVAIHIYALAVPAAPTDV
jgi:hypothetical protein